MTPPSSYCVDPSRIDGLRGRHTWRSWNWSPAPPTTVLPRSSSRARSTCRPRPSCEICLNGLVDSGSSRILLDCRGARVPRFLGHRRAGGRTGASGRRRFAHTAVATGSRAQGARGHRGHGAGRDPALTRSAVSAAHGTGTMPARRGDVRGTDAAAPPLRPSCPVRPQQRSARCRSARSVRNRRAGDAP